MKKIELFDLFGFCSDFIFIGKEICAYDSDRQYGGYITLYKRIYKNS